MTGLVGSWSRVLLTVKLVVPWTKIVPTNTATSYLSAVTFPVPPLSHAELSPSGGIHILAIMTRRKLYPPKFCQNYHNAFRICGEWG